MTIDLTTLGIIIIFLGLGVIILSSLIGAAPLEREEDNDDDGEQRKPKLKGGGVIFIGPIPIIFGSDAKWAAIAIILAILLILVSLVFTQRVGL